MILPTEENMRSGAEEVAGTARTFLPKRAIHGTTEEARLNSVRGFLCDGNSCTPGSVSVRDVSIQKPASRISLLSRRENGSIFLNTNL